MIVLLGEDEACVSFMTCMSIQNPDDTVVRLNHKTYRFLTEAGKELLEFEKPLKRISFVDHGSKTSFAGFDVNQFTNVLQRELRAAAQIDPSIPSSLKNIDLIACELGSVVENEPSYAHLLASSVLNTIGNEFNIEIKAFSNIMTPRTEKLTATTIAADISDEALLEISCFKDTESFEKYNELLNNSQTILDKTNQINDKIFTLETTLEKNPTNQAIKKQIVSLNKELETLQNSAKQMAEKIKSFKTVALVTDNIRSSLDTNLKCNFTYQVKVEKLNNELAKFQENKTDNEEKLADLSIQKDKLNNQYNELLNEGKQVTKQKDAMEEKIEMLENKINNVKEKFGAVRDRFAELKEAYQDENTSDKQKVVIKTEGEKLKTSMDTLKKQGSEFVEEKNKAEIQLTKLEDQLEKIKKNVIDIKKISAPNLNQQEQKLISAAKQINSSIQDIKKGISALNPQEKKTKTALQAAGMYQSTAKQPSEERVLPTPPRQRRPS